MASVRLRFIFGLVYYVVVVWSDICVWYGMPFDIVHDIFSSVSQVAEELIKCRVVHTSVCLSVCPSTFHYKAHISPRARGVLFTLSRPKGLRVGPIVEKCAEFRNPFLKKISTELFSEIEIKQGYPLFKISHINLTPKLYCYQFLS